MALLLLEMYSKNAEFKKKNAEFYNQKILGGFASNLIYN